MKILQTDAIVVQNVISQLLRKPMRPDLAADVAILYTKISDIVRELQSSFQSVEGWEEYQKGREALTKEHGTPQPNGTFSLSVEANKMLQEYDKGYSGLIEEQSEYSKAFQTKAEKTFVDLNFKPIEIDKFDFNIEPGILVELLRCGILYRREDDGDKQR